jgi:hypothetical protein
MVQVAALFRGMRARTGITLALIGVLLASVALATFVFALVEPFVVRPLPYPDPDHLIAIRMRGQQSTVGASGGAPLALREWQARTDLFVSVVLIRRGAAVRFATPAGQVLLRTIDASPGFFDVLGGGAKRWPSAPFAELTDTQLAIPHSVARRVTATTNAAVDDLVGATFPGPERQRVTIAALLDQAFVMPDAYAPLSAQAVVLRRDAWPVDSGTLVVARRRPDVSLAQIAKALSQVSVDENLFEAQMLRDRVLGRTRIVALWSVAGVGVMLLACLASLFNLLCAAGGLRRDEFVIRALLGASRLRIWLLVMRELAIVAVPATAVGLATAAVALSFVRSYLPEPLLLLGPPTLNTRAISAGVGVTVALVSCTGLVAVAILPSIGDGPQLRRTTKGLRVTAIVVQSTIACVLVVGADLLVRSSAKLLGRDTGLDGASVLATVSYSAGGSDLQQEIGEVVRRLEALPGVRAVGASVGSMLDRLVFPGSFVVEDKSIHGVYKRVTPGYFDAVGSTIIEGRPFLSGDTAARGVLINHTMARLLVDTRPVVGRALSGGIRREILGVVKDELNVSLDRSPIPTVYLPLENPWEGCRGVGCGQVTYVVAPTLRSRDVRPFVRRTIASGRLEPALLSMASIDELLRATILDRLFAAGMLTSVALFAVVLCVMSLVGLLTVATTVRRQEMAIRRALGAAPARLVIGVIGEPLTCVGVGIVAGLLVASSADSLLRHLVFGIAPGDVQSRLTAVSVVLLVSILALSASVRRLSTRHVSDALRVP